MAQSNGKEPIIEIKDVVKSFPVGDTRSHDPQGHFVCSQRPGEFVSIVGPSGNGKSRCST